MNWNRFCDERYNVSDWREFSHQSHQSPNIQRCTALHKYKYKYKYKCKYMSDWREFSHQKHQLPNTALYCIKWIALQWNINCIAVQCGTMYGAFLNAVQCHTLQCAVDQAWGFQSKKADRVKWSRIVRAKSLLEQRRRKNKCYICPGIDENLHFPKERRDS